MKKYKRFQLISSVLIGGCTLVSIPVLITSCKTKNSHKFIDASFDSKGIKVNIEINNLSVGTWNGATDGNYCVCGTIDPTNWKVPNDYQSGHMSAGGNIWNIDTRVTYYALMIGSFQKQANTGTWFSKIEMGGISPATVTIGNYDATFWCDVGYYDNSGNLHHYQNHSYKERITITA